MTKFTILTIFNSTIQSVKYIHILVQAVSEIFSSCKALCHFLGNHHSPSDSLNLTTLGASYKWTHTVSVCLLLAYFT